jgi:hypothetical protein
MAWMTQERDRAMEPTHALNYCRVSTANQQDIGMSLDSQLEASQRYA